MCSVVILRRPGHDWPLILGANRDEMTGRPWLPPGRHWPERSWVLAGLDRLAGGSWLGVNDHGLIAGVMNRSHSLGPAAGKRSRGELVLEALDHADAAAAADALLGLEPSAYRPFNLILADNRDACWLRHDGQHISAAEVPSGLSMLTAHDLNDEPGSRRIRYFLPRFRAAPAPRPEANDWQGWQALLSSRQFEPGGDRGDAMTIAGEDGFGTLSSTLLALPAPGRDAEPILLFAAGPPDRAPYEPVPL